MAYKEILFHAFEGPAGEAVQNAAFDLATRCEARVIGLAVVDNTPIPSYVVPYVPGNMTETYLQEARQTAKALEPRVIEGADKAGLRAEWRYVEGEIRGIMNVHARYADLVVLAQGSGEDVPLGPALNLPDDLVLTSGRPVLVVPFEGAPTGFGSNILIAWNGSAQSSRAVHDALPLLQAANSVTVLTVGPEEASHIPGAEITAHLVHHGVNASADHAIERDHSTADTILHAASDAGANLIICGAWGHSRFLETVLGGVTRHLLRHMKVPVLMSH